MLALEFMLLMILVVELSQQVAHAVVQLMAAFLDMEEEVLLFLGNLPRAPILQDFGEPEYRI